MLNNKDEHWLIRQTLSLLPEPEFQKTAAFVEFLDDIAERYGKVGVSLASQYGYAMEEQEVVNLIFVQLLKKHSSNLYTCDYVARADVENPWAYLGGLLKRWIRQEYGVRGIQMEEAERIPQSDNHVEENLSLLHEVVAKTYEILAPRTPEFLHHELFTLLEFLAVNPPQRLSYEKFEREAAMVYCPHFTERQVAAVMNIAWGGRPKQRETSVMGQILLDPMWLPEMSVTHTIALSDYKKRMFQRSYTSKSK